MSKKKTRKQLEELAIEFNLPISRLQAFIHVESRGAGFDTLGRIVILFERHKFYVYSGKVPVSKTRPDLSNKQPGGYSTGATGTIRNGKEHQRLEDAKKFHEVGAMLSCSWGAMQVMGFNHKKIGYATVQDMVKAFEQSEYNQIRGGLMYCQNTPGLIAAIQCGNWKEAARLYNGSNYAINQYDTKLASADEMFTKANAKNRVA